MEIICPECQFSRQVDETKIPARSQVATCPKCQTKFQFRDLPEEEVVAPAPEQVEPEAPAPTEPKTTEPAPKAAPVQKPLPDVMPEPKAETPSPSASQTAATPESEEEDRTFPHITAPGEDPKEGLWDKLDSMAPPEATDTEPAQDTYRDEYEDEHYDDSQHTLPIDENESKPVPGWNGEFSDDFPDPMQDELAGEDEDEHSPLVPPPFEQLDRYGFFHGLYMTVKLVLTSPRLFFSVMPVGGGLAKPLTFTILLTMIQGFVQYFWGMAGLSTTVGPEGTDAMAGVSNALAPIIMLLFMPAFIAAGQFIITGIYHVLLIAMRADNKGFEGTFRALAYANAPIILGIFPMPMAEIEVGWMFIAAIWGLFLTITGLRYIHQTSYAKVIPVCLIPLLLAMIAGLMLFSGGMPTI